MNDAECKLIEQETVEKVRKALKTLTSGEIYDRKGYLNEAGYNALEEIEGLDLFWICDPLIKLVKKGGKVLSERPNEVTITNKQYELFLAQQGKIEQLQKENEQLRKENSVLNHAIAAQYIDFPNSAVKSTEIDVKV